MRSAPFHIALAIAAGAVAIATSSRDAAACSPAAPGDPIVLPRTGATEVPTRVDVVVVKSYQAPLVSLATAAGEPVPLGPANLIARGYDAVTSTSGSVYRVRPTKELAPNTEHVVTVDGAALARFTTGAGYGKSPGVAPIVKGGTFTRVRYPVSEIASGNCVFAEYVGFASLDWSLGTFPDTPSDSTVHLLSISAKTGGQDEPFVWIGKTPWAGVPTTGDHPDPIGIWQPVFDPTRDYCFSVMAYPYGEAVLPTRSGKVCGSVAQKSTPGAPDASNCQFAPSCPHQICSHMGPGGRAKRLIAACPDSAFAVEARRSPLARRVGDVVAGSWGHLAGVGVTAADQVPVAISAVRFVVACAASEPAEPATSRRLRASA